MFSDTHPEAGTGKQQGFGRLWTSLEVFRHLWESLDMFENLPLPG